MTIRFFSLQRLVARLVHRRRRQLGLRTLGACALAALMGSHAGAQSSGGSAYPPAIGGSLSDTAAVSYDRDVPVGNAVSEESGVVVGPGGVTTVTQLPSVLGPAPGMPGPGMPMPVAPGPGMPGAGPLVNQPFPNGPFIQSQPVYQGSQGSVADLCDGGCDLRYYGSAEALYFRRENDEHFTLSQNTFIQPFDYDWAGRVTVGRMLDCVNGYEASYVGPFQWTRQSTISAAGTLQSKLNPDVLTATDISAFNNADVHSQFYRARLNSFEFNKRCWAWDIFSTLVGIRVIDYREDFLFLSTNGGVGTGIYQDNTRNIMVGPQVGGDWMTPVGLRGLVGFRGKGAAFANFNRNQVFLQNAGVNKIAAEDNAIDLAGMLEFGTYAKYAVTQNIRLTAGYDFWYLTQVATVPGQNLYHVGPNTGLKSQANDEVFVHGASFGAQILY